MEKGLYYLALPYHGTQEQQTHRKELSLKIAAEFLRQGIHLFAPILYVNQIAEKLELPSLEERRQVVMPYLFEFLKASKGMVLVMADGWQDSWGVQQEILYCQERQIPVHKLTPDHVYGDLRVLLSSSV